MERAVIRNVRRRRKNKITGGEMRQQYCFTLFPSVMDKVEAVASRKCISVSLYVNNLLEESHASKKK